jgi:RNA polymerase sigma-70 factor (ECF subfamily)
MLAKLLRQHSSRLRAYVKSRVSDAAQIDDVLQEVSLVVLTSNGPDNPKNLLPWSLGIARHLCARIARQQAREASYCEPDSLHHDGLGGNVESGVVVNESLREALANLSYEDRAVLLQRYLLGESAHEIGRRLGHSETAVRMQLMRARKRARRTAKPLD